MDLRSEKKLLGLLPYWAIIPILIDVAVHWTAYYFGKLFAEVLYGAILGVEYINMTLPIDALIPVNPEWSIFYYPCVLIWVLTYVSLPNCDKKGFYRFVTAETIGSTVSMLFFMFLPTTMTRAELPVTDLFTYCLNWIYKIDAPTNLFPSMHILMAWLMYRGIAFNKLIPKWIRVLQLFTFFAVCYCILTIRQHVFIDIIGGLAVAELGWYVSGHFSIKPVSDKVTDTLNKLFNRRASSGVPKRSAYRAAYMTSGGQTARFYMKISEKGSGGRRKTHIKKQ